MSGSLVFPHHLLNHLPPRADLAAPPKSQNSDEAVLARAAAESPAPPVLQPGTWTAEGGRKSPPQPGGTPRTVPFNSTQYRFPRNVHKIQAKRSTSPQSFETAHDAGEVDGAFWDEGGSEGVIRPPGDPPSPDPEGMPLSEAIAETSWKHAAFPVIDSDTLPQNHSITASPA